MKQEKGSAMIELAVVMPFFIILLVGIVDIFFIIQKNQQLSVLVRETANVAYRKCVSASDVSTTNCLNTATAEARSFVNNSNVIQGAQIVVRSWKVDETLPVTSLLKGGINETGYSKFDGNRISNLNSYNSNLREGMITVEVFLPNNGNTPFFNRNLYEAIVF